MARIGFMPTRTAVEVREPDGDVGTIPPATAGAAGVMTAEHVRLLLDLTSWRQQQTSVVTPAMTIIETPPPDLSRFATRDELRALAPAPPDLEAIAAAVGQLVTGRRLLPAGDDASPQLAQLREEVAELRRQPTGDGADQAVRTVLGELVERYRALDDRVHTLERVIDQLRSVAAEQARRAA